MRRGPYRGVGRYCETKLANILFTTELARRLDGTGLTAKCFHPGLVATGFNRNNGLLMNLGMTILRPVARSPEKGAETLVWLATSPDVANVSGVYFFDQEQRPPSPEAQDRETARRLWEISERQVRGLGAKFVNPVIAKLDLRAGARQLPSLATAEHGAACGAKIAAVMGHAV
jgi:hypothetical protein